MVSKELGSWFSLLLSSVSQLQETDIFLENIVLNSPGLWHNVMLLPTNFIFTDINKCYLRW